MELKMSISNIKSIHYLDFNFPLESGLYAITGENSSGKSTLVTCAATVFYEMPMYDYIGRPNNDASIRFELNGATRSWIFQSGKWIKDNSTEKMKINGFYEGSIIFGNRFRDAIFSKVRILDGLHLNDLEAAEEYIREKLGEVLHDDISFYKNLYVMKGTVAKNKGLSGTPYFYSYNGNLVNQARMSTGENLLVGILHSLNLLRKKRTIHNDGRACIVFLDEIELALHASALRRLVHLLTGFAEEYNCAIFFSTHSLELLRGIKPQNMYYLSKLINGTTNVTNPCYPAYATRNLYSDDGYGLDFVIFVEDDVAQNIVERVMLEKDLLPNARVKILPAGGWTNTISMAFDVISSHLLLKDTRILIVLDKDIKPQVPGFLKSNPKYKNLKVDYLPISSLEKYLKKGLVDQFDKVLYEKLDKYVFQKKPLSALLNEYAKTSDVIADRDGKSLYGCLINELRGMRKDRNELVEVIIKHVMSTDTQSIDELGKFLSEQFDVSANSVQ